jgi:hypothetical protein
MADTDKGLDLGDIIKLARTKEVKIALAMGKDGFGVAGDLRKGLGPLFREAKDKAGGAKGGSGIAQVKGKELHITFTEDGYPSSLKKALKTALRDLGLQFKPVFIGADGVVDSQGDEDEATAEGAGDAAATPAGGAADAGMPADMEAQLRDKLAQEYEALKPDLAEAKGASPPPMVKKIEGLEAMLTAELDRAPKKGIAVLGLLKKMIEGIKPASGGAPDPAADARRSSLADLEKSVDALLKEFA